MNKKDIINERIKQLSKQLQTQRIKTAIETWQHIRDCPYRHSLKSTRRESLLALKPCPEMGEIE